MSGENVESSGMALGHLEELAHIEGTYWWHVAKRNLVINLLERYCSPPGKLLEGGVGAGGNLAVFKDLGYIVKGLDALAPAVDYCHARGLSDVHLHDLEEPWPFDAGLAFCPLRVKWCRGCDYINDHYGRIIFKRMFSDAI